MVKKKMVPIGIENFEEICTEGFYYIDKTLMIKELLDSVGKVTLFTRPRRFGKSLNMSMLKFFFDPDSDKTLFEGLNIMQETKICEKYMGKFPVISISLKGAEGRNYEEARAMMCATIGLEALRFQFLEESEKLAERDRNLYRQLVEIDKTGKEMFSMSDSTLAESLRILSSLLYKHYGKKAIILIDEYDVPLDKANHAGYYEEMVQLLRKMFHQALKSNDSLQLAVLTGCLRVSKESIFTGLNNLRVVSITDVKFDEYFGFTDQEVKDMMAYYDLMDHYETAKEWYDGYKFGNVNVYCPWDVINYCDDLRAYPRSQPKAYWSNTSSNDIVRKFIDQANAPVRREIEQLIAGESIKKTIRQDLTYKDLDASIDNLWSVLFMTGYLTQRGEPDGDLLELGIPNRENRKIFITQVMEWFRETTAKDSGKLSTFCMAFRNGDAKAIEEGFNEYLKKTISIRDTNVRKARKENFYQGILLVLLSYMEDWIVQSNAESGDGYSDILVEIEAEDIGIVIEMKYAGNDALETECQRALKQISEKQYEEKLFEDGMTSVIKYGIACYKKRCKVIVG